MICRQWRQPTKVAPAAAAAAAALSGVAHFQFQWVVWTLSLRKELADNVVLFHFFPFCTAATAVVWPMNSHQLVLIYNSILAPFFHFLNLMNTHTAFDDVYRSCRLRIEYIQFFLSHYFSFIPFPSIAIVNLHLPIYQTGRLASLHIDTGSTAPAASVALAALTALNRKRKLKQTNAYNFSA